MIRRWFFVIMPLTVLSLSVTLVWPYAQKLFIIEHIFVHGARRTNQKQILWATGVCKGTSLAQVSLNTLKKRFLDLPWVKTVSLRRLWPESLYVHILEKEPLAIWIHKGQKSLVDGEGAIIPKIKPKGFSHLVLLKGPQAPLYFPQLLCLLDDRILSLGLRGAVFLRSGRWDLHFKNGMILQLPSVYIPQALAKLRKVWPLVEKAKQIDVRFPDAVLFQETL